MDQNERIAVLEEQHRGFVKEVEAIEGRLDSIHTKLDDMQKIISRQRGFWAGVTFMASIIGFAISQVWQFLHKGSG